MAIVICDVNKLRLVLEPGVGERVCANITMLCGCFIFALLIGTLSTVMMGRKLLEEKVDRQMAELREFMVEQRVPADLKRKVRRFMVRAGTTYRLKSILQCICLMAPLVLLTRESIE